MFWLGLFLGLAAGIVLMGIVSFIGMEDHYEDDWKAGYDQGFYDGMQIRRKDHGEKSKV